VRARVPAVRFGRFDAWPWFCRCSRRGASKSDTNRPAAGLHRCCWRCDEMPGSIAEKMSGECGVIRGMSDVHASRSEPGAPAWWCQASSLVGALARLGCTRIGSPGIFGVQPPQRCAQSRIRKSRASGRRRVIRRVASSGRRGLGVTKLLVTGVRRNHRSEKRKPPHQRRLQGVSCSRLYGHDRNVGLRSDEIGDRRNRGFFSHDESSDTQPCRCAGL
jgi:hypothetical protein